MHRFPLLVVAENLFFLVAADRPAVSMPIVLSMVVLLAAMFVVNGAEVAFLSLTVKDLNMLRTKQDAGYRRIAELMDSPKVLMGCLLLANTLLNLISIFLASNLLEAVFPWFAQLPFWWVFLLKWGTIGCVIGLFGIVMPKVMAAQNNIRFARDTGLAVEFVYLLFKRPCGWMVEKSDEFERNFGKPTGIRAGEMDQAIDLTTADEGSLEEKHLEGHCEIRQHQCSAGNEDTHRRDRGVQK